MSEFYLSLLNYVEREYAGNVSDFCDAAGISRSVFYSHKSRETPTAVMRAALRRLNAEIEPNANALRREIEKLSEKDLEELFKSVADKKVPLIKEAVYIRIPLLESLYQKGEKRTIGGKVQYIDVEQNLVKDIMKPCLFLMRDNSMAPKAPENTYLIVETEAEFTDLAPDSIGVFYNGGAFYARYCKEMNGKTILVPANLTEAELVEADSDFKFLGIVKQIIFSEESQ